MTSTASPPQSKRNIRIVSLTDAGQSLAIRLAQQLSANEEESEQWHKPSPFTAQVQSAFEQGDALILICATGIAVRTLAPVLKNKLQDPPVLVLDELGKFVIPLLSGHEGGANEWGDQIAQLLGAQLVITTAKSYIKSDPKPDIKQVYTIGMGCERGCPLDELQGLLNTCLQQARLTIDQIHSFHSIDIKADEVALIALAKHLNKPFKTWHKDDLTTVEGLLSTKSDYVFSVVGVYGVAESAALYAAHVLTKKPPELVLTKQKNSKATCAIARA